MGLKSEHEIDAQRCERGVWEAGTWGWVFVVFWDTGIYVTVGDRKRHRMNRTWWDVARLSRALTFIFRGLDFML